MDWYKRDIGAYRRATSRLKPLQHGVYNLLLDEYYSGQGPLPDDWRALFAVARAQTEGEKKAVKEVVGQFFTRNEDGLLRNTRCDEEIAQYRARSATNKAIAQARIANRTVPPIVQRNVVPESTRIVRTEKEREIEREKERSSTDSSTGQNHSNSIANRKCSGYDAEGQPCQQYGRFGVVNSDKWYCDKHKF